MNQFWFQASDYVDGNLDHLWRTSEIATFATNIEILLLQCDTGGQSLQILHNNQNYPRLPGDDVPWWEGGGDSACLWSNVVFSGSVQTSLSIFGRSWLWGRM